MKRRVYLRVKREIDLGEVEGKDNKEIVRNATHILQMDKDLTETGISCQFEIEEEEKVVYSQSY